MRNLEKKKALQNNSTINKVTKAINNAQSLMALQQIPHTLVKWVSTPTKPKYERNIRKHKKKHPKNKSHKK